MQPTKYTVVVNMYMLIAVMNLVPNLPEIKQLFHNGFLMPVHI